jgi:hypothetical protein
MGRSWANEYAGAIGPDMALFMCHWRLARQLRTPPVGLSVRSAAARSTGIAVAELGSSGRGPELMAADSPFTLGARRIDSMR